LSDPVLSRPFSSNGDASPLPHYAIAILAWPLIRIARRPMNTSPLRTLIYCALEWLAMAILSGFLMLGVSLFTTSTINQALAVLGADASCWRGEGRKRMIRIGKNKNVNLMLVC
jgi:hypothetical protein